MCFNVYFLLCLQWPPLIYYFLGFHSKYPPFKTFLSDEPFPPFLLRWFRLTTNIGLFMFSLLLIRSIIAVHLNSELVLLGL